MKTMEDLEEELQRRKNKRSVPKKGNLLRPNAEWNLHVGEGAEKNNRVERSTAGKTRFAPVCIVCGEPFVFDQGEICKWCEIRGEVTGRD